MRRCATLAMVMVMALVTLSGSMVAASSIPLIVDGQEHSVEAVQADGVTYVALRDFGRLVGATVNWNPQTGQIEVRSHWDTIQDRFVTLAQRLVDLETEVEELSRRVQTTDSKLGLSEVRLRSVETDVSNLGSRVDRERAVVNELVTQARPSVVGIMARSRDGNISTGTGFVIWQDGAKAHVLTNRHVIENGDEYAVFLSDGRAMEAKWWAADSDVDLGLLLLEGTNLPAALPLVPTGEEPKVGDTVAVIGNPLGLRFSVSIGILSGEGRTIDSTGYEYLQTDAAINSGNSGGPLLDLQGRVVGVVTAKTAGVGIEGLGFAIPIGVYNTLVDIANNYEWSRPYFGVRVSEGMAAAFGVVTDDGLTVTALVPAGPASGILRVGDEILSLNASPVHSLSDMRKAVDAIPPGASVTMRVKRQGFVFEVPFPTGSRKSAVPLQSRSVWEASF